MFADQSFPAVAQTMAGLAVDVENGPIIVKQKEGIGRVIHEDAEAPLACAQLLLRLSQLRDVLQDAKLAQRASRFVPRHVALAVDYSHSAVGTEHPVFDIIAWPPGAAGQPQPPRLLSAGPRGESGLASARAILASRRPPP